MQTAEINHAVAGGREYFRVHLNGGNFITGRIVEVHADWILMRYIKHEPPNTVDLRIIVDATQVAAIEEL